MNSSKIRERKCSTCKHYQPSPLWRKGWCRNPLLYDRNTNHLVEADSLACNRTFIDYWEPVTGPAPLATAGSRAGGRPRIAPSIPMEMVDAQGQRVTRTGITPMNGMSAVTTEPRVDDLTPDERAYADYGDANDDHGSAQSTLQFASLDEPVRNGVGTGPIAVSPDTDARPGTRTGAKKTRAARPPQRPILLGMGRDRLIMFGVIAILLLTAVATISLMMNRNQGQLQPATATATLPPAPTPTGFGDPTQTPTPEPTATLAPTPEPPRSDIIAVGGYVRATSNVTLRSLPTTGGERLGVLQANSTAHVIEGPTDADGYTWWKVDTYDASNPSASGWLAGDFVTPIPPP